MTFASRKVGKAVSVASLLECEGYPDRRGGSGAGYRPKCKSMGKGATSRIIVRGCGVDDTRKDKMTEDAGQRGGRP